MEPIFGVRCSASDEKNGEQWIQMGLFWPKWERPNQLHKFKQPLRQKQGLFSSVFAFLKEHSRGYVTEKRGEVAEKEPFWAKQENPRHALRDLRKNSGILKFISRRNTPPKPSTFAL